MDLNEIKNLIESEGGKFIVVENGKPSLVICSFEEYMKAEKNKLKLRQTPNPQKNLPKELEEEELKIEDLPFTSKG